MATLWASDSRDSLQLQTSPAAPPCDGVGEDETPPPHSPFPFPGEEKGLVLEPSPSAARSPAVRSL